VSELSAILVIAHRDFVKLLRDRMRIVLDLTLPVGLVLLLGPALQAGFGSPGQIDVTTFVFTGVLAQTVWQSAALGVISLVADREQDFSQEMFVSPISRYSIVVGKILGESLVALPQGLAIIAIGALIGVSMPLHVALALIPVLFAMAIFGGAFGLLLLSRMQTQRAANQVFTFVMLPQFFLAGVFAPVHDLPPLLAIASALSPMRYAVELTRNVYYGLQPEIVAPEIWPLPVNLAIAGTMFVVFLGLGTLLFVRSERNR
jgi:ABC-2 type transport system permease protein